MLTFFYRFITPSGKETTLTHYKNKIIERLVNVLYKMYIHIKNVDRGVTEEKRCRMVIVSLTSYPGRIKKVSLCIQSLLRQSIKPDKVILWLAREQFKNISCVPNKIRSLQKVGLEIRFCDDLKSYKKIIYTGQEYPNDIIVTADDDVIYPEDWLERLLATWKHHQKCVCCYRAHGIKFDDNYQPLPYAQWDGGANGITNPSFFLLPTGVCGVLYPPDAFKDVKCNISMIKQLCPLSDDMWLKIVTLKKKIKDVKVDGYSKDWFAVTNSQKSNLTAINVGGGENDIALKKLIDYYKINFKDYID